MITVVVVVSLKRIDHHNLSTLIGHVSSEKKGKIKSLLLDHKTDKANTA